MITIWLGFLITTSLLFYLTPFIMIPFKRIGALLFVAALLSYPLKAQELIFHSGFEPGTQIVDQGSQGADIIGVDNSVSSPNDWTNDLENHPNVGGFNLQYQDFDENQQDDRRAEIVTDPTGSGRGQVLKFWIVGDHVSFGRGRIQANNYGAPVGFTEYYQRVKLYLPSAAFAPLMANPDPFEFLTTTEIWNDNNWNPAFGEPDAYPYRMKVNITKPPGAGQSLFFEAIGEKQSRPCCWGEGEDKIWRALSTYALPLDTWLDIEIYIKEGDATTGRFQLALTAEGSPKQMLIDVTGWTYNPDDPNPDGIRYSNPLKMYTNSNSTIDKVVAAGDSLKFYWDDFELWNNKLIEGASGSGEGPSCFSPIAWNATPFTPQTTSFTAQWDIAPNSSFMDGVVGLSANPAGAYGQLATIVRFNNQGFIDARNGSSYTAANAVSYSKGIVYRVKMDVNLSTGTYSIYATPQGGATQTIGENFAFRTEQASATELGYYNINTEKCRLSVTDFTITTPDGTVVPYQPTAAVKPVLENGGNVTANGDGTYTATFGYMNQNSAGVNIPVGANNYFSPAPQDRGQTTTFLAGRQTSVFTVTMLPGETIVWTLRGPDGRVRTCTASVAPLDPGTPVSGLLNPVADGFVNSKNPDENYGSTASYTIQPKASETRTYFAKFDVGAVGTVENATLRLYNTEWNNSETDVTFAVRGVDDDSWTEAGLTWNNRPAPTGTDLASGNEANGGYTELDVSSFVQAQASGDGVASFFVYVNMNWGADGLYDQRVDIQSRESANLPELLINGDGGGTTVDPIPTKPTELTASNVTDTSVDLTWTASTDDQGVVKYEVLKDTQFEQSVFGNPPAPAATVTGLTPGTTYLFYVKAADADGNFSPNSQVVTVTTLPGGSAGGGTALSALADAFVNSKTPDENYGTTDSYTIQPKASETRLYFVKFDLASVTGVNQATLRLHNTAWNNSVTDVTFAVQGVNDDNWTEAGLTWNNRPAPTGSDLATGLEANGGYTDFDVSSFVQSETNGDGVVSFYVYVNMPWGLGGEYDQRVDIQSRESATPPQLLIDGTDANGRVASGSPGASKTPEQLFFEPLATVYPNPSQEGRFILQTTALGEVQVSLYNQQGQRMQTTLKRLDPRHWQIVPSVSLPKGFYFVQVMQPNGTLLRQKLVVSP